MLRRFVGMELKSSKRNLVTIILLAAATLICINVNIYSTQPGLQYLAILYSSGGVLILSGIIFLLTGKTKKYLGIISAVSALISALPIIVDQNINKITQNIGFIFSIFSLLCLIGLIIIIWKTKPVRA
jgi:hypothetical protein